MNTVSFIFPLFSQIQGEDKEELRFAINNPSAQLKSFILKNLSGDEQNL